MMGSAMPNYGTAGAAVIKNLQPWTVDSRGAAMLASMNDGGRGFDRTGLDAARRICCAQRRASAALSLLRCNHGLDGQALRRVLGENDMARAAAVRAMRNTVRVRSRGR